MNDYILNRLFLLRDEKYRDFHSKLIPSVEPCRIIGVRTPVLRKLSGELIKEGSAEEFIKELPHYYYEENNLHAFIICEMKDIDKLISEIDRLLPVVDNWATCDSIRPKIFNKNPEKVRDAALLWMKSDKEYTVRFGIECMMVYFLDDNFEEQFLRIVSEIKSEKYYINMMIAWYFATALSQQWEATLPYLEKGLLSQWVHNKTISKANESFRISDERKKYLKTLKK